MVVTCPNCHEQLEVEMELQVGQHVFCPFCSTKFSYGGMGRGHTKLLTRPWGRNQVLGFVLGLFLGVFGMLIAVFIDEHKYLRGGFIWFAGEFYFWYGSGNDCGFLFYGNAARYEQEKWDLIVEIVRI